MDFPLLDDDRRFCYARTGLLKKSWKDPKVLDALIDFFRVDGKPAVLSKLSDDDKRSAIKRELAHLNGSKLSQWRGARDVEMLAVAILAAEGIPTAIRDEVFCPVQVEADLYKPVAAWLKKIEHIAEPEVQLGKSRVDVLGFRKGWLTTSIIAVELKNDLEELKRGFNQMTDYAGYAHKVYLACTPQLAAKYVRSHAEAPNVTQWEGDVLTEKFKKGQFGLLIVEGNDVYEVQESREFRPSSDHVKEIALVVEERQKKVAVSG